MTYYHGGVPGLRLGDELLPPSITGHFGLNSASDISREMGATHVAKDRVFLATTLEIAEMFAAMYPELTGGWVYECDPVGTVELDPDYFGPDGESVQVERAVVTKVRGPMAPALVDIYRRGVFAAFAPELA